MKRDYAREIVAEMDAMSGRYDRRAVFGDFCHAAAISLESKPIARFTDRARHDALEAEYAALEEKHGKPMSTHFPKALASVVDALEDTRTDILGRVYEGLNATNKHFGQFFTPSSVSRLMSDVTLAEYTPEPGRIVTVGDPACGAGVLLIEFANTFYGRGGRQSDLMFYAEDIDRTAADICYVQLSLLGIAAQVTRMNTLSLQGDAPRFTIGYYLHGIGPRLAAQGKKAS